MLDYLRLEIRRTLREGHYVAFTVGMPVLLYILFSNVGVDGGDKADVQTGLMIGMAAYGGMGAALSNGSTVAEDRALGWLRQLRITPLSTGSTIAGRLVTGLLVVLPAITGVLLAGRLVNDVSLSAGQWAAVAAFLWLGTAPFALLGLGNGFRFSGNTANVANLACNVLLAVVGGLWIPESNFPSWLADISQWTPSHAYGELSWTVADGSIPSAGAFLAVAVWTLAFTAWARRAYAAQRSGKTLA
ncbi:ABC transporter permease [Streptomyces sp. NPDC051940]|uniref:ABC transporter permease n=1 Tax=Streptomyces sp. NPDC051940 TaxID=3155675 RepID=UPI0034318841